VFAEIVTIGDELTRGEIVDTNSSYLAAQLWQRDITVRWMTSCRDDELDMRRILGDAVRRADVVVCSGGLGPTEDDLTVDVVSDLAGTTPEVEPGARARLEDRFGQAGMPVTPLQLRQVRVPAGARIVANPAGLAPGFEVTIGGVPVACLPGPPRELRAIMEGALGDRLVELREARGAAPRIARRVFRIFGRGESQVSQLCRGVVDDVPGASIHYQVKFPEVLVKIVVRDVDGKAARARLEGVAFEVAERLGDPLYATGDAALPEVTAAVLVEAGVTVATAESCTGGLVGQLLTAVPGSSRYYRGGAIVYADAEKVRQLGVAQATLDGDGAVSEACVREMAEGARARFGVDLAVAISGIAGPDGGTPDKPVGTVWLAAATPAGTRAKRLRFPGARDQVRLLAAWWALRLLHDGARQVIEASGGRGDA
jgi:competence/damage-inducible protein CinA-like protein